MIVFKLQKFVAFNLYLHFNTNKEIFIIYKEILLKKYIKAIENHLEIKNGEMIINFESNIKNKKKINEK